VRPPAGRRNSATHGTISAYCCAIHLQRHLSTAFAAAGAIRPCVHIRWRGFANPPLVGTGPLTPLTALIALIQCRHPPQCFGGAKGDTAGFGNGGNDRCSLLRCALATASIYGICGCEPSDPALKLAGANLKCPGVIPRCFLPSVYTA